MFLALLLSNPVLAGDYIQSFEDPIELPLAGGWPRVIPDDDGVNWHLLWAMGGQYSMIPMSSDLWAEDYGRKDLTDGTVSHMLKDHAFTACPSGGYMHIASANVISPNDSAYAFRYDDNFDLVSWSTLEEGVDTQAHNDMPLACSPNLRVTVFGGQQGPDVLSTFFMMDDNANEIGTTQMLNVPQTGGNSFLVEPETGNLLIVEIEDNTNEIDVTRLDVTTNPWTVVEVVNATVLTGGEQGGWPQAVLRINDFYIVAFINQGAGNPGLLGDVMLAVFDFDWNLLEVEQVTHSSGAMTPGLARRDNQLIVSYDRNVAPHIVEVTLDAQAFGLDGGDTGLPWDTGDTDEPWIEDTSSGADTGSSGDDTGSSGSDTAVGGDSDSQGGSDSKGCGCSTSPVSPNWAWPLLGLAGLLLYRRRV